MDASVLREAFARGRDDIAFFAEFFLGVTLHDGQVRWTENSTRKINVLVPGNRYGKSVVTAVKHLHKNTYKKGRGWHEFHFGKKPFSEDAWRAAPYSTINCSISADQSEIVFREAIALINRPTFRPFVKGTPVTPFPRIELWNGATMHARSTSDNGKYIDGHHYAYMSYDEAGWEPQLDWLLGTVLLPRLVDWGGNIDLVGTPKGRGYLYQVMMRGLNGDPQVYSQAGSTYENPYINPEELKALEESLNAISPKLARQALYGDFIDADGLVFTFEQVQGNMLRADELVAHVEYVANGVDYQLEGWNPDPTRNYVVAFDLARRNDRTVGIVLDVTERPFTIVRMLMLTQCPWELQYEYIRKFGQRYNCLPIIDSTGVGDVVDSELTTRGIRHKTFDFNDGRGILKERLITNLQNALDYGRPAAGSEDEELQWGLLRCGLFTPLLDELAVYERDDRKLSTDCVMALAIAVWDAYRAVPVQQAFSASMAGRRGRRR